MTSTRLWPCTERAASLSHCADGANVLAAAEGTCHHSIMTCKAIFLAISFTVGIATMSAADDAPPPSQQFEQLTVRGEVTFARGGDRFAFIRPKDGRCIRIGLKPGCRVHLGWYVEANGILTQKEPTMRMEETSKPCGRFAESPHSQMP